MGDRKVLASAMITSFMTTFMSSALNLSIPALESFFGVSAAAVGWIVSSYTISVAAMSLPMGKLADKTGRRKVFLAGIIGFGIISAVCIFVTNIGLLIALRAAAGICAGMIFSTNNAILISSYPAGMRGKVLGYSTAATYTGLTTGPVIGGFLNSTTGWRSIFAVSVFISAVALTAALKSGYRDSEMDDPHGGYDLVGSLLYIFAIISSLYGMSKLGSEPAAVPVLVCGLLALAAFFLYEGRRSDPLMKVSMFSGSRTFTFSCLAALLNYGATFAISYTVSIYLQVILGISSARAGLILITMPAVQALFSPMTGSMSDRIRPGILASIGMGICTCTLLLFSRIGSETALVYIICTLCLTGFGFALFSSPNTNAILSCVDREDYAVANSIIATMRTYGQSAGMAVLSVITSAILGRNSLEASPEADVLAMMHTAFLVFAVLSVVGLLFSLSRDSRKQS